MDMDVFTRSSKLDIIDQEELANGLRTLLTRIRSLQTLAREDEDDAGPGALDVTQLRQGLDELERRADALLSTVQETDELLADLPDGITLADALSQMVETTAETLNLSSRIVFSGREHSLSDPLARLLYRIAQEALSHVQEHEGARRLRFSLEYQESEMIMSIEDDGVPRETTFVSAAASEGALPSPLIFIDQVENDEPLANLATRRVRALVESLGGRLESSSGIEQGVQVHVHLPYLLPAQPVAPPTSTTDGRSDQEISAGVERIKLLLVDSQAVSRAGLRRLLESYPDLEVVGEAGDHVQAVSETAELLPQIVLIDAQLPREQILEALRQMRQLNAEIHVLLLANQENEELLYEALRAGASGYILKDIAPDELAQAVRTVARGEVLVQPQLAARLLARFGEQERSAGRGIQEHLTAREREVLQLLARGLRNKEIAARLFVSERTVNFHLANIYAKLHVSGRTEALSKALEQGLIKV